MITEIRRWMTLCEAKANMHVGYRIISHAPVTGYRTLAGGDPVIPRIGNIETHDGSGLYLGTSRKFCLDYYANLNDDTDVMLTYEYDSNDLLAGHSSQSTDGEVRVRRAKLVAVEHLDNDC